jgi:hypothetical protein
MIGDDKYDQNASAVLAFGVTTMLLEIGLYISISI